MRRPRPSIARAARLVFADLAFAAVLAFAVLAIGSATGVAPRADAPADRAGTGEASGASQGSPRRAGRIRIKTLGGTFDLGSPEGLEKMIAAIDQEIAKNENKKDKKDKKDKWDDERDALLMMKSLAALALRPGADGADAIHRIEELNDALDLDEKVPVPRRVDLLQLPFVLQDTMRNPVGIGRDPAWNLPAGAAPGPQADDDASRLDPLPSTFWSRPRDIASLDLHALFGPIPRLDEQLCTYEEPKTSYGTSPGFDVTCGETRIKAKFGETENLKRNSEVAVTRFFGALGFHVEPNDYAPEVRVRYDRRIFLEFNSRKPLSIRITALGLIPVHTIAIQKAHDPFKYIRRAVTKKGETLSAEDLAGGLIRPEIMARTGRAAERDPRGSSPDHYREDAEAFESELDFVVMDEANIQVRQKKGSRNIGPWDWNRLGHPGRRELRGAGLAAAWTNYFDARWDNNRLKIVDRDGGKDLEHVLSDLGNSLGRAEGIRVNASGLVNDFPWTFTEGPSLTRKGRVRRPFRIVGYQPQVDNLAFLEMTLDDARWMARLIAALTENQLEQALIATGYTSAEVRLYTEKLISRRDAMVRDLGLSEEIALLRPDGSDRTFDYDPRKDGPVVARAGDGSTLRPRESRDLVVRRGMVEPR